MSKKTVFITGVSSGLGRAIATELLNAGYTVVGTVRKSEAVADFEALKPGQAFAYVLDVRNQDAIKQVIGKIEQEVGSIDVLINNAGYGHEGTLEESPLEELRDQFEVNVFGPVAVMQAVLPFMRERRKGHIINVTSMGGLMTMPGISFYCGSKFALEGISSSLGKELKSFGIFVTALEPGQFRTDWAGRSMVRSSRSLQIMMKCSSRSVRPELLRAAASRVIQQRRGAQLLPSSSRLLLLRICFLGQTHSSL